MKPRTPVLIGSLLIGGVLGLLALHHSQISAIVWHIRNGRDVSWNGHTLTIPFTWRPEIGIDGKTLTVNHATTAGMEDGLAIKPEWELSDSQPDTLARWQKTAAAKRNTKTKMDPVVPYTVVTTVGDVFCVGTGPEEERASFVCKVAKVGIDIRFLGTKDDSLDARAIVGSLR